MVYQARPKELITVRQRNLSKIKTLYYALHPTVNVTILEFFALQRYCASRPQINNEHLSCSLEETVALFRWISSQAAVIVVSTGQHAPIVRHSFLQNNESGARETDGIVYSNRGLFVFPYNTILPRYLSRRQHSILPLPRPSTTLQTLTRITNMSLISRLPNELLLEVFSDYIALPNALDDFHGDTRFILAGVCREWRGLILQAPLLWKAITINTHSVMPYPLSDPTIHPARVFLRPSIALDRAGGLPVDLTIDLPDDAHSPTFNLNHCVLIAKILRRVAPRIASLTISGDDWQMNLQVLIGLLNQPMPLLHTFTHTVFQGIDVCEQTHFESFTEHSNVPIPILQYPYADAHLANVNEWGRTMYPKLESVEISGAPYKLHLLPTTGLKRLGLCNQPSAACPPHALIRDVLSFAANTLEQLWLPGVLHHSPEGPTPAAPTPITLPNLDRLTLGYQAPHEVSNFLPYIHTPALRRLDISDDSMNFQTAAQAPKHSTDAMLDALIRYLPLNQLQRLELGHVIFHDEIPIPDIDAFLLEERVAPKDIPFTLRFLSALSSLEHLEIWVTDQHLLSFLNYPKKPSFGTDGRALHGGASQLPSLHHAHLPSLHTLHLFGYLQEASIQQFLKYRVHATVREKPLNVIISNPLLRTLDEQKFALFHSLTAELARGSRIVEVDNDVVMG